MAAFAFHASLLAALAVSDARSVAFGFGPGCFGRAFVPGFPLGHGRVQRRHARGGMHDGHHWLSTCGVRVLHQGVCDRGRAVAGRSQVCPPIPDFYAGKRNHCRLGHFACGNTFDPASTVDLAAGGIRQLVTGGQFAAADSGCHACGHRRANRFFQLLHERTGIENLLAPTVEVGGASVLNRLEIWQNSVLPMSIGGIHTKFVFPRRKRVLVSHLASLMPPSAAVLDVGCGDGSLAAGLVVERPDITIRGVEVLMRQETAIPVTIYDGERIPFDDASADVVMFVDVLHHTDDPMVLLNEANRVSRRWILIKDHFRNGFLADETLRFMDRVGNSRFGVALPYNYWSSQQWDDGFARLGLTKTKQILRLGLYPFWADWLFGRGLHFVLLLEKQPNAGHQDCQLHRHGR